MTAPVAVLLASCASTPRVEEPAAPAPNTLAARDAKEVVRAADVVFRSLWARLPASDKVGELRALTALSYAFCRSGMPCEVQVTVTAAADGCQLEIKPEVLIVTSSDVDITWTIVGSTAFKFSSFNDIDFHHHPPGRWRNKTLSNGKIIGVDGYDARDGHLYDVSVHSTGAGKGCGTDPIIVNTG